VAENNLRHENELMQMAVKNAKVIINFPTGEPKRF
jgi:hypothetical protein